jgi:hypothetical protein
MKPLEFEQQSVILNKPDDMTDEECGSLPIYSDGQQCISLWRMSWRERISSLFFGRVWLWVHSGKTQPAVGLSATRDVFEKEI